ncbi:hypothetical protein M569_13271, partial [Genlisea aurea]
ADARGAVAYVAGLELSQFFQISHPWVGKEHLVCTDDPQSSDQVCMFVEGDLGKAGLKGSHCIVYSFTLFSNLMEALPEASGRGAVVYYLWTGGSVGIFGGSGKGLTAPIALVNTGGFQGGIASSKGIRGGERNSKLYVNAIRFGTDAGAPTPANVQVGVSRPSIPQWEVKDQSQSKEGWVGFMWMSSLWCAIYWMARKMPTPPRNGGRDGEEEPKGQGESDPAPRGSPTTIAGGGDLREMGGSVVEILAAGARGGWWTPQESGDEDQETPVPVQGEGYTGGSCAEEPSELTSPQGDGWEGQEGSREQEGTEFQEIGRDGPERMQAGADEPAGEGGARGTARDAPRGM